MMLNDSNRLIIPPPIKWKISSCTYEMLQFIF